MKTWSTGKRTAQEEWPNLKYEHGKIGADEEAIIGINVLAPRFSLKGQEENRATTPYIIGMDICQGEIRLGQTLSELLLFHR